MSGRHGGGTSRRWLLPPQWSGRRRLSALLSASLVLGILSLLGSCLAGKRVSTQELGAGSDLARPDGLVANERGYWSNGRGDAPQSSVWDVTAGSLFIHDHAWWTGVPDATKPDWRSQHSTNSAVFRIVTKKSSYENVTVRFRLLNQRLTATQSTPPEDWDGVHIFLRYQSQFNLYYASVNRRDGRVTIKKKVPGGPDNGGTYFDLSHEVPGHPIQWGQWRTVGASVQNGTGGIVTISVLLDGKVVLTGQDTGQGGPPITASGGVGIRGDNDEFLFNDFFVVTQ
jgi:hypothetical protein